ncbi:hypothetical protein D3C76_1439310 [compost metagenome]
MIGHNPGSLIHGGVRRYSGNVAAHHLLHLGRAFILLCITADYQVPVGNTADQLLAFHYRDKAHILLGHGHSHFIHIVLQRNGDAVRSHNILYCFVHGSPASLGVL